MTNNDELVLKLKAAAEIIGSEKWHTEGSNVWNDEYEVNGEYCSDLIACCEDVNNDSHHADFIATANPANILALLAERDAHKKRIAELEGANASQDDHINQQQDRIDALELRNSELGKYAGKLESISSAAEKLVRCKGRYHSEQNYRALAALFGVTTPDLPPLETEARTVSVKLPRDITHVTNKYFEEGRDAVLEAIESQLAADGINLEVGE